MTLTALALTVLAGCASTDTDQTASREESYTPLGSYLPRKNAAKDERTLLNKEEFKRQQEMAPTPGILPKG
jgi:type IV pilus biogenesis protein CpaD/CtpE